MRRADRQDLWPLAPASIGTLHWCTGGRRSSAPAGPLRAVAMAPAGGSAGLPVPVALCGTSSRSRMRASGFYKYLY